MDDAAQDFRATTDIDMILDLEDKREDSFEPKDINIRRSKAEMVPSHETT